MLLDHPFLLFLLALFGLWAAALFGAACQKIWRALRHDEEDEFKAIQAAALTGTNPAPSTAATRDVGDTAGTAGSLNWTLL